MACDKLEGRYTAFKASEKCILVATNIFGQRIDVEWVDIVVNSVLFILYALRCR
jgi:hypothetical protein